MRRPIALVLASLIANVACAWILAIVRPQDARQRETTSAAVGEGEERWILRRVESPGMTRLYWAMPERPRRLPSRVEPPPPVPDMSAFAPDWSHVARRGPDPARDIDAHRLVEVGFGWPWTTASYEYRRLGTGWSAPRAELRGAIDLGDQHVGGRLEVKALPVRPAWGGLAGNTVLYALVVAGLIAVARLVNAVLMARRDAAGCCQACGYDLSGAVGTRCPECGWESGGACRACGYDLSGAVGDRCPECGDTFGSTTPRTSA